MSPKSRKTYSIHSSQMYEILNKIMYETVGPIK
jgi:hypothetical protein